MMHESLIIGGLVVAYLMWRGRSASGALDPSAPAVQLSGRADSVYQLARSTVHAHSLQADPEMLVAIAKTESDFRSGLTGDGGRALGLMQVLESTGRWLAGEMGYTAFGRDLSRAEMLRDDVSMYLAASYLDWLQAVEPDATASERYTVRAYNGGRRPDGTPERAAATESYWQKYRARKLALGFQLWPEVGVA